MEDFASRWAYEPLFNGANMAGMSALVIGGGGREHALCLGLARSESINEIHCAPGNAGTAEIATNHPFTEVADLIHLAFQLDVDFVVVGPEAPLCDGLADKLANMDIPCFGPVAALARLEGSKLHAKQVMAANNVPTADFHVLGKDSDIDSALDDFSGNPWVVKRDVLAGGKGVVVTDDRSEAKQFIEQSIISDGQVLLEKFLPGDEASMLVVMDGSGFVCLPASQDHKREFEGDKGRNTGGMGAYAPAPVYTDEVRAKTVERIVQPMHKALSSRRVPYRGVLYVGLMIDENNDPFVVEFNVRFGDPECQITIPLIASDLGELLSAASNDKLSEIDVEFHDKHALTVVLAAENYPGPVEKGRVIQNLPQSSLDSWVNHAGTKVENNQLISNGGRVLSCTAISENLNDAASKAYSLIEQIELAGSHYRNDIGHKAL
ncbi:MAG: phosphoribosylamine--glycine ligase [Candidatus Poseidoniales archaeon]|nr:MAG: phosphoribosylamine--glycine ligase [Candidatus Poseidoniales archaeon]